MNLEKVMFAGLALAMAMPVQAETLNAMIRLQEKVPLEQLADNVRNPGAPRFGAYYSPTEIREIAAPSDEEYSLVVQQLKNEGLQITGENKTHLWIAVKGDSTVFEKVFQARFQFNKEGKRQLQAQAQVPTYMSLIASVGGLENHRQAKPLHHFKSRVLSNTPGGISPATIKTVYGFDSIYASGISGQGQHIAVATYNDFNLPDVQYFYQTMNISPAPSIDKVPFNGAPPADENSAMETQLDAEFSGMMAPGANVHVFSSATNDDAGELAMFTAILNDNRAKVVNYSWGSCEKQVTAQHAQDMTKVFAQAVAQGVTILVASGDSGSDSCQDGSTVADWPAAHPDVTAVGGTTLALNGKSPTETAWNGSGGGISQMFDLPNYQAGLGGQFIKRSYPDVAFNADPASGQAIYAHQNGVAGWLVIGGTSMAAPQWAGFLALVGNARAAKNLAPMGFLNPLIYATNASQQAQIFTDITVGANGAYTAQVGWDAVTGFGSMKAQSLLNFLSAN